MAITLGGVKPMLSTSTANPMTPTQAGQQASDTQLQSATQQMGQSTLPPQKQAVQQAASQVAQVKGDTQLQESQKQADIAQKQSQAGMAEAKVTKVKQILELKQQTQSESLQNEKSLDSLGLNLKSQYVDSVMKFNKDELGRTAFNNRQLADWAATKARNEDDYAKHEAIMNQAIQRKQAVLDQAYRVISQSLNQQFETAQQANNQVTQEKIAGIRKQLAETQLAAKRKAASDSAMWNYGGAIIGMAAAAGVTVATGGFGAGLTPTILATSMSVGAGLGSAGGSIGYSQK